MYLKRHLEKSLLCAQKGLVWHYVIELLYVLCTGVKLDESSMTSNRLIVIAHSKYLESNQIVQAVGKYRSVISLANYQI